MNKKIKKRSFLYHSAVYWVGRMLSRSTSIVLLPVYTAYLVPDEYGILSVLRIVIELLMLVLGLELPTAIYRYMAKAKSDEERQVVLGTSILLTIFFAVIPMLPLYLWSSSLIRFLDLGIHVNLFRLVLFEIQLALVLSIFYADMRIRDESKLYAAIEIIQNLAVGALSVLFVAIFGWGIAGMICAQTLIFFIIVACCAPRFFHRINLSLDLRLIKILIGYSLPLIPAAVAMMAVHTSDRLFIKEMLSAAETGIYSVGYKFGTLVSILILGPFLLIWQPKSFEIAYDKNSAVKYGEIFSYLTMVVSFMAVALTGLSHEIVMLLTDEKYWAASRIIPWVAWSYVFFAMSLIVRVGLLAEKRTILTAGIVFMIFMINLAGNFFMISRIGMLGAAISTLISFVIYFFLNLFFSYRYIPIKFEMKKLFYLFLLIIAVTISMNLVQVGNLFLSIVFKVLILAAMAVVLFFFGFFTKLHLRQRIKPYLSKNVKEYS